MDSTALFLLAASVMLAIILNAIRFMRFVGFLTGSNSRTAQRSSSSNDLMSFDERLAERLRELESGRH